MPELETIAAGERLQTFSLSMASEELPALGSNVHRAVRREERVTGDRAGPVRDGFQINAGCDAVTLGHQSLHVVQSYVADVALARLVSTIFGRLDGKVKQPTDRAGRSHLYQAACALGRGPRR